jgi:hypothetical protein
MLYLAANEVPASAKYGVFWFCQLEFEFQPQGTEVSEIYAAFCQKQLLLGDVVQCLTPEVLGEGAAIVVSTCNCWGGITV